ncbi:hypothetical protein MKX01_032411 [Papaver californicum]|nr:hypothetical protein MKX01_032411 [Papaver californicum]
MGLPSKLICLLQQFVETTTAIPSIHDHYRLVVSQLYIQDYKWFDTDETSIFRLFQGWKVASFVGLVFSQSLSHIVAISNLMPTGITAIMAIFGTYLSDAYNGIYRLIFYSTIIYIYITGLLLLTLSAFKLHPETTSAYGSSDRLWVFRMALLLVALGKAGHTPMLKAFGACQLKSRGAEDDESDDKIHARLNCWWCIGVNIGAFCGILLLAIVEGRQYWIAGYGVLTLTMCIAFCIFVLGKPLYKCVEPRGSLLSRASRVLVAAFFKGHLDFPTDASQLYHGDGNQLLHTDSLHVLQVLGQGGHCRTPSSELNEDRTKRRLCTVMEVEETKLLLRMSPIWTTFLKLCSCEIFGEHFLSSARKQHGPKIQPRKRSTSIPLDIYQIQTIKNIPRIRTSDTPIVRIGIGLIFGILCCSIASSRHELQDRPKETLPINVFWLTPQFMLLGAMDGFTYPGIKDFYYNQVPESMWSFGPSFTISVIGFGSLLGVIDIAATDKASKQGGRTSWFADSINKSRLDIFYLSLVILSCINLVFYGFLARKYTYKKAVSEDNPNSGIVDTMNF